MDIVWVVPFSGLLTLAFVAYLAWDVMRRDTGTKAMQEIAATIYEGARAFLNRQYRTIGVLAIVTAILIGAVLAIFQNDVEIGVRTSIAFLVGAGASALSGFIGMFGAGRGNGGTA